MHVHSPHLFIFNLDLKVKEQRAAKREYGLKKMKEWEIEEGIFTQCTWLEMELDIEGWPLKAFSNELRYGSL